MTQNPKGFRKPLGFFTNEVKQSPRRAVDCHAVPAGRLAMTISFGGELQWQSGLFLAG